MPVKLLLDKEKNVAINFKFINPTNYSYTITFNHNEKQEKYFYQSNIEYIIKVVNYIL